jgi:hypothetical protein
MPINKALLKYGHFNFTFEILKYCEPFECIKWEQHYMEHLKPEYNVCPVAGSRLGSKHSEETRKKISEALKNRASHIAAAIAVRSQAVLVKNIETGNTVEYVSQREAARELGVDKNTISNYIKSRKALKGI